MQKNDQNKLMTKTKERAEWKNELTNEPVAASLFDSNLFIQSLIIVNIKCIDLEFIDNEWTIFNLGI